MERNFSWSRSIAEIKKPIVPSYQSYTECSFFNKLCSMHLSAPFLMAISVNVKCRILGKTDFPWKKTLIFPDTILSAAMATANSLYSKDTPLFLCHTERTYGQSCNCIISETSAICVCNQHFPFSDRDPLCPISFAFFPLAPVIWL